VNVGEDCFTRTVVNIADYARPGRRGLAASSWRNARASGDNENRS
jgi:hypothetical protein